MLYFEQRFNEFYRTDEDIAKVCNLFVFNEYSYSTLLDFPYYKYNLNYLDKTGNIGGALFVFLYGPMSPTNDLLYLFL